MKISTLFSVYEPAEDSYLLINALRKAGEVRGLSFCDIGCGTGTVGLHAAAMGAKVTLVDITPDAVALTKKNAQQNTLSVSVVQSDLFTNVKGIFDVIVCNPPYLPAQKGEPADSITTSLVGGKHGYEWTVRFLEQAKEHLYPKGVVLFLVSSLSKPQVLETHMTACGFSHVIVGQQNMGGFETLYVYMCQFLEGIKDARTQGCTDLSLHGIGKRGLVFKGQLKKKTVAVKIKRESSAVNTLVHEADMLQLVNAKHIGPRYVVHTQQCLIMEFIDGRSLKKVFSGLSTQKKNAIVKQLLTQSAQLDELRISKA